MKKKIYLSALLVFLASLLLGVGTYAYFNATANSSEQFTAGTIAITANRDASDPVDGPMFYTLASDGKVTGGPNNGMDGIYPDGVLKPGFESIPKTLVITNKGSITPKLTKVSAEYQSGDAQLAETLEVEIYRTINPFLPPVNIYTGTLEDLLSSPQPLLQEITISGLNTQEVLIFKVRFPETGAPQNQYQGMDLKVKFFVHAVPN